MWSLRAVAWGVRPEPLWGRSLLVDLGQDTCCFCERGLIMALGKAWGSGRRSGLPSTGPLGEQQGGGCVWRGFRVEDGLNSPALPKSWQIPRHRSTPGAPVLSPAKTWSPS